ncbi:MAG: nucleotidyltransferase domain-containing protein [Thermoleophilia bacterium]|nr:nucleotidyltransferase domain-containing protein [Thermoleophilia bacterium]
MVASVVDEVHPECIVLFGSRARDDGEPDSDIDLLVVEEDRSVRGVVGVSRCRESGKLCRGGRLAPISCSSRATR